MGQRSGSRLIAALAAAVLLAGPAARARSEVNPTLAAIKAEISLRDFSAAAAGLKRLAGEGIPQAQYLLGVFYLQGLGGPRNTELAQVWLKRAALHGDARAAFTLGTLLGQQTPPDPAGARRWLARARALGYRSRQSATHRMGAVQPFRSAALTALALRRAIEQGNAHEVRILATAAAIASRDAFGRDALDFAAETGRADLIALLLRRGASPRTRDLYGITPLMLAADSGNVGAVETLLHAGATVNAADRAGNTALMRAAHARNLVMVQRLLAAGASVAARNVQDWSALDFALQAHAKRCAELLSARGATALAHGRTTKFVITAVQHPPAGLPDLYRAWPVVAVAAARNSVPLLQTTPRLGGSLNTRVPGGTVVLTIAAESDATKVMSALLIAGKRHHRWRSAGAAALTAAIAAGRSRSVTALLAEGISPNRAPGSVAPIMLAARSGNAAIVRALAADHARLDVQDNRGTTPMMLFARRNDFDLVQTLLAAGARPDVADDAGRTALWYAASAGALQIVQLLAHHGALIDRGDSRGVTPLSAASMAGSVATVAWLAARGARVDARTRGGNTPLMIAASAGRAAVIQELLQLHADINARNALGDTALIIASRDGNLSIVRQLLAAGAATDLRDHDKYTARDIAAARSFRAIVVALRSK